MTFENMRYIFLSSLAFINNLLNRGDYFSKKISQAVFSDME